MVVATLRLAPARPAVRDEAVDILTGSDLDPIVDMVAWSPGPDVYEVASSDGRVRFRRERGGDRPACVVESVEGSNPLAVRDPAALSSVEEQLRRPHPHRRENSYPHGYEQFAQLFDHPSAPDLCVVHTASHHWPEAGGHLGEHGSPGVVQARAPFVASGAGIATLGPVDRSCRLVDIAPTVLALLGGASSLETSIRSDGTRSDGDTLTEVLDGTRPHHVIGLLFDGTNASVLYDQALAGRAPNVARLMAEGLWYRHGAMASLPTVTLANHTTILTGLHPGHHGILHNAWMDRATGEQVVTNSPLTWPTSMRWLSPGVQTLFEATRARLPGVVTAAINEPCETGADYSTFDLVRRGETLESQPMPDVLPDATQRFVRPLKSYRWSSRVDHTAVEQFCGLWSGSYRGRQWPVPAFTWVNFTLTDAAFHEGGPYSEIASASLADTDARLGRLIDAVERSGRYGETAWILVADHGMSLTDPSVRGDWDEALRSKGLDVRDEGYGFVYLPS